MSRTTREINRITTAIISICVRLIAYALIVLLLYEAVCRGYAFGHAIFFAEAMENPPGHDVTVTIEEGSDLSEVADLLEQKHLIANAFAFSFQGRFYGYDEIYPGMYQMNTSMTSKEILQMLNEKPEEETSAKKETSSAAAQTTKASEPTTRSASQSQEAVEAYDTGDEEDDGDGGWIVDSSDGGNE